MKRFLPVLVLVACAALLAAPVVTNAVAPPPYPPMIASQRFEWQQPLPQGNPIERLDFVSDTLGWAIGDNGTVLKTTDGGFSWANQGPIVPQGGEMYTDKAMDVCFVDANNGWIAIGPRVYRTTDGGSTWAPTSAWVADFSGKYFLYQSVDFADATNGWFIGSYQMFHTTDGGSTVTQQSLPAGATPNTVQAVSSTQAFAYATFQKGFLATSDGGATWEPRYFAGTAYADSAPVSLAACSASTLYATFGADLLKTSNGGSTWTTVTVDTTSPGDYLYRVHPVDGDSSGNRVYLETDGAGFHYTTDGGDTWHETAIDPDFTDIDIPSANTLFRVNGSRVYGSTSAGDSWYKCFGAGSVETYQAVDFTSKTTGHAMAQRDYARTTDGGKTWALTDLTGMGVNLPSMNDVTFLDGDPNRGWLVGNPAGGSGLPSVYRTIDGGASWQSLVETRMVDIRRVRFADANNGWAISIYPKVWRTTDGGDTWAEVPLNGTSYWDVDFVDADNGWIAFTGSTIATLTAYHTTDGGSTWVTQTVGASGGTLQHIDFVDANNGYAVDSFDNLYKTADAGEHWTEIELWPWAYTWNVECMKFSTPLDGWLIGWQLSSSAIPSNRHDFAAHTTDGGETWDFYDDAAAADNGSTGTNVGINAVDSIGGDTWLVGGNGAILKYRQRPVATITPAVKTLSAYGGSFLVTGTLSFEGAPLVGKSIEVWTSGASDGTFAKSPLAATTTPAGTFELTVKPSNTTYYRVKFGGDSATRSSSLSSTFVKVIPQASVGTPRAPSAMKRNKYYTVYGYLKPRHTSGTHPVRIYKWKKTSSGRWKSYGYIRAKASNYSTYTKYAAKMRLTKSGKWRLRAYHPADSGHAAKWSSSYDYVRVP